MTVWKFLLVLVIAVTLGQQSSVLAQSPTATTLYPTNGAMNADLSQPIQWTSVANVQAYYIYVGTTRGTKDLVATGEILQTSYQVPQLPAERTIYARMWTKIGGVWQYTGSTFTVGLLAATSLHPLDGATGVDLTQPFHWTTTVGAQAYHLYVGMSPGANDVLDIRTMAPSDNRPSGWTALSRQIASQSQYDAFGTDYAATLLHFLAEMNIQTAARYLNLSFTATRLDVHMLVELLNLDTGDWILLDPTFSLSAKQSDGEWASAEDVSQATLAFDWQAISYVFLSAAGDSYARDYYLDYPLLYVNVYHQGQPFVVGQGPSPLQYLQVTTLPTSGSRDVYLVQCSGSTSAEVLIDGTPRQVTCDGVDATSGSFYASSVAAPTGIQPSFQLYRLQRFVF